MAGIKGKSGGARMGSGPFVRRIQLSKESAIELRTLILNRRSLGSSVDENQFIANLIHEKWLEYDDAIQQAGEQVERFEWHG